MGYPANKRINGGKMINGSCKAKDLKETITQTWLKNCIPVPPLESIDFGVN
jgi:hypothetical protein